MSTTMMGAVVSLDGYIAHHDHSALADPSRGVQGHRVTHLLYDVERAEGRT